MQDRFDFDDDIVVADQRKSCPSSSKIKMTKMLSSTSSSRDRSISPPRSPIMNQRPHHYMDDKMTTIRKPLNTFNNYNTRFDRVASNYNTNHFIKKPFKPYKQPITNSTFQHKSKNYLSEYKSSGYYNNNNNRDFPITKPLPRFSPFDKRGPVYTDGVTEKRLSNYRPPKHSSSYSTTKQFKRFPNLHLRKNDEVNCLENSSNRSTDFNPSPNMSSLTSPTSSTKIVNDSESSVYCFRIKRINSYREFCEIKTSSRIAFSSPKETISFLNDFSSSVDNEDIATSRQPIMFFLDETEGFFYGAASLLFGEIAEKENIDTNAVESMIFRLNWIYLSEVSLEESQINLETEVIDTKKGLQLLKLMELNETQLHDIKKLKATRIKLKRSRLDELADFFSLSSCTNRPLNVEPVKINIEIEESILDIIGIESMDVSLEPLISTPPATNDDSDDDFFADYGE